MKLKTISIIALVFLASLYSFINSTKHSLHNTQHDLKIDNQISNLSPATPTISQAETVPTLEQQLAGQFNANGQTPANKRQSLSNQNPDDEDLVTEVSPPENNTPYPSAYSDVLDERGELLGVRDGIQNIVRRWNANTNEITTVLALTNIHIRSGWVAPQGLFFLVDEYQKNIRSNSIVWLGSNNSATSIKLQIQRKEPKILLLKDQSLLIIGGKNFADDRRVNSVERIKLEGDKLVLEQLPDMPGPPRWGYSLLPLANGEVMSLGGNTSEYTGCKAPECKPDTYILNPTSKVWRQGPTMLEPHAAASVSQLNNGTIMITGGWRTPNMNAEISRVSEHLLVDKEHFETIGSLAIPVENGKIFPANSNAPLILEDPTSGTLQSYNPERSEWRVVADFPANPLSILGPFIEQQTAFLWVAQRKDSWQRITFNVLSDKSANRSQFDPKTGLLLYRSNLNLLSPTPEQNGLLIGESAVDSLSLAGHIQAIAPLNHARTYAQAFRLLDGSMLVASDKLPMEWIPQADSESRWITLDITYPSNTQFFQRGNDLLALQANGVIEQLSFQRHEQNTPTVIRGSPIPPIPMWRGSYDDNESNRSEPLAVQALPDGRLIVAGGLTQRHRIAVIKHPKNETESVTENNEDEDQWVGIGQWEPTQKYAIFNPTTRTWQWSSKAQTVPEQLAILNDGRVMTFSSRPRASTGENAISSAADKWVIEMSSPDGKVWRELNAQELPSLDLSRAKLVCSEDEIFMIGQSLAGLKEPVKTTVQWFDVKTRRWSTVWQSPKQVIGRQTRLMPLTLANKKIVLLPIEEY